MNNPHSDPSYDFEYSEGGNKSSVEQLSGNKSNPMRQREFSSQTSTEPNLEQEIFQIERAIIDLDKRMKPILETVLLQSATYKILDDERNILIARLNKRKSMQIDRIIPPRSD